MGQVHGASTDADASAATVWAIWSDPKTWPEWNPDVTHVSDDAVLKPGAEFEMTTTSRANKMKVVEVTPGRSFALETRGLPGSTFVFECSVTELTPDRSRLAQTVRMNGPTGPIAAGLMGKRMATSFQSVVDALAKRAALGE